MTQYSTIAELQNFIVLDNYTKSSMVSEPPAGYQTEAALEREFIEDLISQGYEYVPSLVTPDALLCNARNQLQAFNNIVFTDSEWGRFLEEYLDKKSDSPVEKTKKYTVITSVTLCLMMGILRIYTWQTRRILPATKCR